MAEAAKMSVFDEVNVFFDRSAERLGLDDGVRELLRRPWRECLGWTQNDGSFINKSKRKS